MSESVPASSLPVTEAPEAKSCCAKASKAARIAGWILSVLIAASFAMGGVMDVLRVPMAIEGMKAAGYPEAAAVPLGIVILLAVVLYLVRPTAAIGAILLTGYMGGAVATHVINDNDPPGMIVPAIVAGVLVWLALVLRDARVRAAVLPTRCG